MRILLCLAVLASAVSAASADCPAAPDIGAAETDLFARAQEAQTEQIGRDISRELWKLWATAPDALSQDLLDKGMSARASFNFVRAIEMFDRLVAYCPDYAEGYNQRAFVNFLREDYELALVDLDLALDRAPRHVAALSGKALTLMGLGRQDEAQEVLREAMMLNPWIPERGLLIDPVGQEL
jgi:tetratricopeptide (TPR) repeat protein